ncbi:DUF2892 domain-containing protein [Kineosporiaceae bacterium SCSIO 59966]|nr:DUF2892 domain-containing protein [Kineosporiaceae bacterium SCSIO 59966]
MARLTVNISPAERAGRIIVGLGAIVAAAWLLTRSPSTGVAVLEVLLGLVGLDLVVTGALGHCPLYSKLGHVPKSLRRTT